MIIQFYVVFNRILPLRSSLSVNGEMIIEWNVFIQKYTGIDKGKMAKSIRINDAQEAITTLIYSLKDVTGFDLSKIADIQINFRNGERKLQGE